MENIIDFKSRCSGCFRCVHMMNMGNGTFLCTERTYSDGSAIYPMLDNKPSDDWGACDGIGYERRTKCNRKKGVSNE